MATGKQSANFRQNMLVVQNTSAAAVAVTHGDMYKIFASTFVGTAVYTLPGAVPGAGPFYWSPGGASNVITLTAQGSDTIGGLGTSVTLPALIAGDVTFFGLICVQAGVWTSVTGVGLNAMIPGPVTITPPAGFTPPGNNGLLTVFGPANGYAATFYGSSTANQSFGVNIQAGTSSADIGLKVSNQANNIEGLLVRGDGAMFGWGPVAATNVLMTPDTGSFTAGTTGASGATFNAQWKKIGNCVTVALSGFSATGSLTTFTITGIPAAIQPVSTINSCVLTGEDNTVQTLLVLGLNGGSASWTAFKITLGGAGTGLSSSGWTAAGTRALVACNFSYIII